MKIKNELIKLLSVVKKTIDNPQTSSQNKELAIKAKKHIYKLLKGEM